MKKRKEDYKKRNLFSVYYESGLTVWIATNYGKFLKRWEYQTT